MVKNLLKLIVYDRKCFYLMSSHVLRHLLLFNESLNNVRLLSLRKSCCVLEVVWKFTTKTQVQCKRSMQLHAYFPVNVSFHLVLEVSIGYRMVNLWK